MGIRGWVVERHCCIERERRPVGGNGQVSKVVRDLFIYYLFHRITVVYYYKLSPSPNRPPSTSEGGGEMCEHSLKMAGPQLEWFGKEYVLEGWMRDIK